MLKRIYFLLIGLVGVLALTSPALAQGPVTPRHTAPTWEAWYWNNKALSGPPILQRSEANLDYDWRTGSPAPGINADSFSARWTRYIEVTPGTYRFTTTSDDGMRVWVDGDLIINEWSDHAAKTVSADKELGTGHHLLVVEFYENAGQAVAKVSWALAPATIKDWRGEYFNNLALSGTPVLIRDDAQINFDWGVGSPAPGPIGSDQFSVRWTRTLNLSPGLYRFTMIVDDGGRLWVNDHLLIDAWRDQPSTTYTGDIYLPGGPIPVKMEYYENGGSAVARLHWATASEPTPGPLPPPSGWLGQYYANKDLAGSPALTRIDTDLHFDWGTGSPAPGIPADNFSVRWTREVYLPAGTYTSFVQHDDGARLWIDGVLAIDSWHDQSATTHSDTRTLNEGIHRLQVEYYEHTGQASLSAWAVMAGSKSPPAPKSEVMVDNTDPGFTWGGPIKGRQTARRGVGDSLYWTYNSTRQPVNYGKWTPHLPAAGQYEVLVYIPRDYGNSTRVRYRILHNGQRHDRHINQESYSDQWISLGAYGFKADNRGREFVAVYDNTREPYASRTIAFDAVKFVSR